MAELRRLARVDFQDCCLGESHPLTHSHSRDLTLQALLSEPSVHLCEDRGRRLSGALLELYAGARAPLQSRSSKLNKSSPGSTSMNTTMYSATPQVYDDLVYSHGTNTINHNPIPYIHSYCSRITKIIVRPKCCPDD
jgi:hypothetical protein